LIPPAEAKPSFTETLEVPKKELTTGSTFAGRYQIIEELGKGGMGKVYKVFDQEVQAKMALKIIKPEVSADKNTIDRFRNELKIAWDISHKNICRMYDLGREAGAYFITMEYVSGEDLKSFIRRSRQLVVGTAIFIAKQVCEGLAEAHRLGVVHRDLKPGNVMIDKEGNAKIMDFGIARCISVKGITGAGVMIGTPEYMSPEQVEGKEVDQRSDIYSLGIILYEMATGRVPFEGDTALSIAVKHKTEIPKDPREFNPQIPEELSRLILKCMEKEKGRRYQRVDEILAALVAIESVAPTTGIAAAKAPDTEKILEARRKKSIAVLPFSNLSPEKEQEYFCDGLSEEIINALSHIQELRVVARTSAFAFKGKEIDIREVGEKLNVGAVLEGSVRKSGQRLRITAQLVNVEDGYHLWSGQFDREMKEIFDIQEEISLTIVDHLKLNLLKGEKEKILKRHTEDHEAYELYLKGRYFWKRRYEKGLQKSLQYFQLAAEKDPGYALPHMGIADAYGILGVYGFMPPHQAYPQARAAANKALEIDPGLGEVYASLGWIAMWYDSDWPAAQSHFLKGIQMKPDYPEAHLWYGNLLFATGRFDEAVREMRKGKELEPLEPAPATHVGWALYFARRFDESLEELRQVIESDPDFSLPYMWQSENFLAKKMWREAIAAAQKFVELSGESVMGVSILGLIYGFARMKDEALKILERLDGLPKDRYVGPIFRALVWTGLGEKNKALEELERAYLERESAMAFLGVWPIFDSLRSEPRFKALLKKMNLE
jgi:serine/threonine protein kinase/Tfp pilus assembly protein PilF